MMSRQNTGLCKCSIPLDQDIGKFFLFLKTENSFQDVKNIKTNGKQL